MCAIARADNHNDIRKAHFFFTKVILTFCRTPSWAQRIYPSVGMCKKYQLSICGNVRYIKGTSLDGPTSVDSMRKQIHKGFTLVSDLMVRTYK
jgi:hypothetical protein